MTRRSPIGLTLGLLTILFVATARTADPSMIDAIGRPEGFKEGIAACYGVWHENGEWNLRMTNKNKGRAAFVGHVVVEGDTLVGEFQGLEKSKRPADADKILPHKNRKGFDFKFTTFGKVDGVGFTPGKNAKTVTFKLLLNGDESPDRIMIGKSGAHPDRAEFTLPAHPKPTAGEKK